MIYLCFYKCGVFVFNVDDWYTLRKTHRIIGEIAGNTTHIPALPVKLIPEEVLLLLEKSIAKIVEPDCLFTLEKKTKYEEYEEKLFKEQEILYRNNRKQQLEKIIEDIVKAKRKKGDERSLNEIFEEELEKSCKVSKDSIIWPTFLTSLVQNENFREYSKEDILKQTTKLKAFVFKDLWEKGYYVTQGHKFGGDFLVYKGDPLVFHAIFIVRCVEDKNKLIHPTELIAFGRLGTSVRKRAVLAYLNEENTVCYMTINWIDA